MRFKSNFELDEVDMLDSYNFFMDEKLYYRYKIIHSFINCFSLNDQFVHATVQHD